MFDLEQAKARAHKSETAFNKCCKEHGADPYWAESWNFRKNPEMKEKHALMMADRRAYKELALAEKLRREWRDG